jgi:hypothetical protein
MTCQNDERDDKAIRHFGLDGPSLAASDDGELGLSEMWRLVRRQPLRRLKGTESVQFSQGFTTSKLGV